MTCRSFLPRRSIMFDWFPVPGQAKETSLLRGACGVPKTTPILLDLVGCMGLSTKQRTRVDPYCVVSVGGREIHRTKTLIDDTSPIFTVKTRSLCIVEVLADGAVTATTNDHSVDSHTTDDDQQVMVAVHTGSTCLGHLFLSFTDLLEGDGEREEHCIGNKATLALRFRRATQEDLAFLGKIPSRQVEKVEEGKSFDINFYHVRGKSYLARNRRIKDNKEYHRILPFPDPDRREETAWMTHEEIIAESLKPSKRWVSAGQGTTGKVYLEILGCEDLPNLDYAPGDLTDPFVVVLMEDIFVRTDIVYNNLNPRWMPWTNRAFVLNIHHPTSILMLGVFDYDEVPVDYHDPVGRVVINLANFRCNTEYTLSYKLRLDPRGENERGTLTIRLRIDWFNESEAIKTSFAAPPRFIINVDNDKSFRVLRYLTRGAVDMENATVASVKLYAKELFSYWEDYCFVLDVLMEVLLWRGRISISEARSVWFPIHSIVLFGSVVLLLERPNLAFPILLYGIAWVLLSVNYHASRHPYPWKRVKASEEINAVALFGRSDLRPESIEPGQGWKEGTEIDKLDKLKAKRMSSLISALLRFLLRVYRIYGKTSLSGFDLTTQKSDWSERAWSFLSARLYYLHLMLKHLCLKIRLVRNFVNWKSYATDAFTANCIFVATLWLILPANRILHWVLRILAWSVLGPWMKLVDILFVHAWFETKEELLDRLRRDDDPEPNLPDFDAILQSERFLKMIHSGRVMAEDSLKLKDMREEIFGYYAETIPKADGSRYPNVPLPTSTAVCLTPDQQPTVKHWYSVPGQKLEGNMIHRLGCPKEATLQTAQEAGESKKED